jgi:hypothetical protein
MTHSELLVEQKTLWQILCTIKPHLSFPHGKLGQHGKRLALGLILMPPMYSELLAEVAALRERGVFIGVVSQEEYEQKLAELHEFEVLPTEFIGHDTGRRRYWVKCLTCDILVHPATTGPESRKKWHLEDPQRSAWWNQKEAPPVQPL